MTKLFPIFLQRTLSLVLNHAASRAARRVITKSSICIPKPNSSSTTPPPPPPSPPPPAKPSSASPSAHSATRSAPSSRPASATGSSTPSIATTASRPPTMRFAKPFAPSKLALFRAGRAFPSIDVSPRAATLASPTPSFSISTTPTVKSSKSHPAAGKSPPTQPPPSSTAAATPSSPFPLLPALCRLPPAFSRLRSTSQLTPTALGSPRGFSPPSAPPARILSSFSTVRPPAASPPPLACSVP